jgi:Zn-finger nucleic acid-binding protein
MNFMGRPEGGERQVELKYCERCGGLWLRVQGADGIYCASCHLHFEARPDPGEAPPRKARRRKARLPGRNVEQIGDNRDQGAIRISYLQGVAATGVWA